VLIWVAFRNTPFSDVWSQVTLLQPLPLVMAVAIATVPFVLRVPRWKLLLRHEDGTELSSRSLWHAIAIGFAGNNVLPFRLGELLRMASITRQERVAFPSALSSVAIERVLDGLTAVGLLGVALIFVSLPGGNDIERKAAIAGLICTAALLAALLVAWRPTLALTPLKALVPEGRFRILMTSIVERLVLGVSALADYRRALPVIAWSIAIWLVNAAAFWMAFDAFGIELTFAAALVLQGILLLGIALPQAPGFAGGFEAAISIALVALFGIPREIALAYAITYHVTTFIPITLLGLNSLRMTGLSLRSVPEATG
jgi:uncharacterized protein (TIRG00374 family)